MLIYWKQVRKIINNGAVDIEKPCGNELNYKSLSHGFCFLKKKNQSAYKPGSVLTHLFEMRSACHLSAPAVTDVLYRSTLQRVVNNTEYSDEQPSNVGIHELSTSDVYSPHVTTWLVSSYLTFSPLPSVCILKYTQWAVLFFYTSSPSRTTSR